MYILIYKCSHAKLINYYNQDRQVKAKTIVEEHTTDRLTGNYSVTVSHIHCYTQLRLFPPSFFYNFHQLTRAQSHILDLPRMIIAFDFYFISHTQGHSFIVTPSTFLCCDRKSPILSFQPIWMHFNVSQRPHSPAHINSALTSLLRAVHSKGPPARGGRDVLMAIWWLSVLWHALQ